MNNIFYNNEWDQQMTKISITLLRYEFISFFYT